MSDPSNWLSRHNRVAGNELLDLCRAERAPASTRRRALQVTRAVLSGAAVAGVSTAKAAAHGVSSGSGAGVGTGASSLTAGGGALATGGAVATPLALGGVAGQTLAATQAAGPASGLVSGVGSASMAGAAGVAASGPVAPGVAVSGVGVGANAGLAASASGSGASVFGASVFGASAFGASVASVTSAISTAVSTAVSTTAAAKVGIGVLLLAGGTYLGATTTSTNVTVPVVSDDMTTEPGALVTRGAGDSEAALRPTAEPPAGVPRVALPVEHPHADVRQGDLSRVDDAAETSGEPVASRGVVFEPSDLALDEEPSARRAGAVRHRTSSGSQPQPGSRVQVSNAEVSNVRARGAHDSAGNEAAGSATAPDSDVSQGSSRLAGELALIKRARLALREGHLDNAEQTLRLYAQRYPKGSLLPEAKQLRKRLERKRSH